MLLSRISVYFSRHWLVAQLVSSVVCSYIMLRHIKADNLKRLFFQFCTSLICTTVYKANTGEAWALRYSSEALRPVKSSSPWLPCRSQCPCPGVRSPDRKLLPLGRSRVPGLFVRSRIYVWFSRIMGISSKSGRFWRSIWTIFGNFAAKKSGQIRQKRKKQIRFNPSRSKRRKEY